MYRTSFYHFLMTLRQPDSPNEVEQFANNAFLDTTFPKQSQNLEENANYLPSMTIFDDAWQMYLNKME